ncbi:MAG: adenylate/guanylate cyclase domain-containing protein [Candidatus Ozemobacteraceae bacterium]
MVNEKTSDTSLVPLWERAFLFFIFIFLPLTIGFFFVCQSIDQQLEKKREGIRRMLEFRTNEYLKSFSPEQVLLKILRGQAKHGKVPFQEFLYSLENFRPGTFKIIAWDQKGMIIPFQGPVLSGKKMWQIIIRRFFLPTIPPSFLANQIFSDPDLKSLQMFLGKKTPLEFLLPLRNAFLESVWLEKPCYFFQYTAAPAVAAKSDIAGALVLVLHRSLPEIFWQHAALKMGIPEFKDGETVAIAVDMKNPRRSFSSKGVYLNPNFKIDLLKCFSLRNKEVFSIDQWLAMEVKNSPSLTQRVFLLADFSKAWREAEEEKSQARCLFLFLLILFFLLKERITQTISIFSFRRRISGLFSLALLLPTLGFIFLGIIVLHTEKEKCRNQASEQMKSFCSLLTTRFNAFPSRYGHSIHKVLAKAQINDSFQHPCLPILNALIQRGRFSSYYLSDATGRVETVYDPGRGPMGAKSLRFAVQKGYADSHSQFQKPTSSAAVENSLKRVIIESSPKDNATHENVFQAGELRLFHIGSVETYIMIFDIVFRGEYRVLLLEINSEALERTFAEIEIRKQGLEKPVKNSDYTKIRWEFLSRNGVLPSGSPVATALRHVANFRGFGENQRLEGEMVLHSCPVFFNFPEFSPFTFIRPIILFPQQPWTEKISLRKNQLLLAVGISLGISLLLGLVLGTGLLSSIGNLDSAVKEICAGNLGLRLPDLGNNELGRLNRSFNDMAGWLQERQRMRSFVSSSVLEAVSDEKSGTMRRGENRTVAVLFSHIKDFNTLSTIASPKEIFAVLNDFLAGAETCIRAFGGEVDKFIGDAVMAIFLREDREIGAVKAAFALRDFVEEWNRGRRLAGLWTISIGIGINTGTVMMGDLGSSRRKDLTVIGDTVNLAARLESVSTAGFKTHIILSESTFTVVRKLISAEELSITRVKGKTESIRMFELTGVRDEA